MQKSPLSAGGGNLSFLVLIGLGFSSRDLSNECIVEIPFLVAVSYSVAGLCSQIAP